MTAEQAIDRSASHSECVVIPYSEDTFQMLCVECDENSDVGTHWEFWGTTEDGNEWRVHVDPA